MVSDDYIKPYNHWRMGYSNINLSRCIALHTSLFIIGKYLAFNGINHHKNKKTVPLIAI